MTVTITTRSSRTRTLPENLDPTRVAGLDPEGRIVVNDFDARNASGIKVGEHTLMPYMFALTLCCDASDKGVEDGVVCRGCYGTAPNADAGDYLFRAPDGTFPGLDEKIRLA